MTPFEVFATIQRDAPSDHRLICHDCATRLLAELAGMFPAVEGPHIVALGQCSLLGCTLDYGDVDQCAMHAPLQEYLWPST